MSDNCRYCQCTLTEYQPQIGPLERFCECCEKIGTECPTVAADIEYALGPCDESGMPKPEYWQGDDLDDTLDMALEPDLAYTHECVDQYMNRKSIRAMVTVPFSRPGAAVSMNVDTGEMREIGGPGRAMHEERTLEPPKFLERRLERCVLPEHVKRQLEKDERALERSYRNGRSWASPGANISGKALTALVSKQYGIERGDETDAELRARIVAKLDAK